jgi:hypothetical protein
MVPGRSARIMALVDQEHQRRVNFLPSLWGTLGARSPPRGVPGIPIRLRSLGFMRILRLGRPADWHVEKNGSAPHSCRATFHSLSDKRGFLGSCQQRTEFLKNLGHCRPGECTNPLGASDAPIEALDLV